MTRFIWITAPPSFIYPFSQVPYFFGRFSFLPGPPSANKVKLIHAIIAQTNGGPPKLLLSQ